MNYQPQLPAPQRLPSRSRIRPAVPAHAAIPPPPRRNQRSATPARRTVGCARAAALITAALAVVAPAVTWAQAAQPTPTPNADAAPAQQTPPADADATSAPADPAQPLATEPAPAEDAKPDPHAAAAALFAEGSRLFTQWRFAQAEAKYRAALEHSDQATIRLYLARAREKQGALVEAHAELTRALAAPAGAMTPHDAKLALDLRDSLMERLAEVEASCDTDGAEVYLDGEPWFVGPGRQTKIVRPGQHVIIARKRGYFPITEPVSLLPGRHTQVKVTMAIDEVQFERRWQPWKPWAVAATGVTLALAGGGLVRAAARDYDSVRSQLASCQPSVTCEPISTQAQDSGLLKQRVGSGLLIAGGVLAALGGVAVAFNQPRARRTELGGGVELELSGFSPLAPSQTGGGLTAGISLRLTK